METSTWKKGPIFLQSEPNIQPEQPSKPTIQGLEQTNEAEHDVTTEPGLLEKLKNFSSWSRLVSFIKTLAHARKYKKPKYMDNILVKDRRTTLVLYSLA